MVSSEFDAVNGEINQLLEQLRMNLQSSTSTAGAGRLIHSVISKVCPNESQRNKDLLLREFEAPVIQASKKGLQSFNKHIQENLSKYGLRMRYCIKNEPDGSDDSDDSSWNAEFFGCGPRQFGNKIIIEWLSYKLDWNKRKKADPKWFEGMSSYDFWVSHKTKWPTIADCALWWINFPTSNICVERSFALGRVIDSPRRGAQSWEVFANELMIKCNKFLLDELLQERVLSVKRFHE